MIVNYIDIERDGNPSLTTLLYDDWIPMLYQYIIGGRERYYVPKKAVYDINATADTHCLLCWIVTKEFNHSMFRTWDTSNLFRQLRKDLEIVLNEKQNKIILEVISGDWKEDVDSYFFDKGLNGSTPMLDCCTYITSLYEFPGEDEFIRYDLFNMPEIVHDRRSSKGNKLNVLRNWIGSIREQILEEEKYFRGDAK